MSYIVSPIQGQKVTYEVEVYNNTRKAWQPYYDSITIGEITTAEEAFKKIDNAHPRQVPRHSAHRISGASCEGGGVG